MNNIYDNILEKGFTFIELMVVVAIIGISTIAILKDAAVTYDAERAKFQIDEIQEIVRAATLVKDATTVGSSKYQNLSTSYLVSHKMISERYLNSSGTSINHLYGGAISVSKWLNNGYVISMFGVPQQGCMDFIGTVSTDTVGMLNTIDGGNVRAIVTPSVRNKNLSIACLGTSNNIDMYIYN